MAQLSGWNLFSGMTLKNCTSAIQPHALKWTIRVYCGWCWGAHANSSRLCSGRVCSLRPLSADRLQKKAAKCRGLVLGRGQFSVQNICPFIACSWEKVVPVLPHFIYTCRPLSQCCSHRLNSFFFFTFTRWNALILNCTNLICVLKPNNIFSLFTLAKV